MLGRLNICSKEWVIRQYDHEVQGMSVIKPLVGRDNDGPSDAAVLRPLLDSMEGVIVANGICPRYSDIDTYHMVASAIDEAIRNVIAVGGQPGPHRRPGQFLLARSGPVTVHPGWSLQTRPARACQSGPVRLLHRLWRAMHFRQR